MKLPKLTEVFLIEKMPSHSCPNCGSYASPQPLPKTKKPGKQFTPIRANGVGDDPVKDTGPAEHFDSKAGTYCMYKISGGSYAAHFLSKKNGKAEELDPEPSRKEMIDAILLHHDKKMAGM